MEKEELDQVLWAGQLTMWMKIKMGSGLITLRVGGDLEIVVRKNCPNGQTQSGVAVTHFVWMEQ